MFCVKNYVYEQTRVYEVFGFINLFKVVKISHIYGLEKWILLQILEFLSIFFDKQIVIGSSMNYTI